MEIIKTADAGTAESGDCTVVISPNTADGIIIELESSVEAIFGDSIRQTVKKTLDEIGVINADIKITDKGALDCIIRSRVQCAAFRAAGEHYDWSKEDL